VNERMSTSKGEKGCLTEFWRIEDLSSRRVDDDKNNNKNDSWEGLHAALECCVYLVCMCVCVYLVWICMHRLVGMTRTKEIPLFAC